MGDKDSPVTVVLLVLVIGVFLLLILKGKPCRSGFTPGQFGNAEYQNSTPNKAKQWRYNRCVVEECGGDTNDYACQQRCRLKVYRRGMEVMDTKDWACWQYGPMGENNEDAYYRCLGGAYADWKYP